METPYTSRKLALILEQQGWNQLDLSERCGVHRATVGSHLNDNRAIRDEHLAAYLRVIPALDVPGLFAAWVRDLLSGPADQEVLNLIFPLNCDRVSDDVSLWSPQLTEKQRSQVDYIARNIARDPDIALMADLTMRRIK